jgi:hypothetical protein
VQKMELGVNAARNGDFADAVHIAATVARQKGRRVCS